MDLHVVVNMSDIPRVERSATHKPLVLVDGVRWQRWKLVVREWMGEVGKKPGFGVRKSEQEESYLRHRSCAGILAMYLSNVVDLLPKANHIVVL